MLAMYQSQEHAQGAVPKALEKDSSKVDNASSGVTASQADAPVIAPTSGGPVSYVKVEAPFLPSFTGESNSATSYNLWKYELKCLVSNPEVSRTSIMQAVRKSRKKSCCRGSHVLRRRCFIRGITAEV